MAKKQLSFAEKATKQKSQKDWKTVKFVKSERSDKTGSWRFNESFIRLATNENIDQALTRMEKEVKELAEEMASMEDISPIVDNKSDEKVVEVLESKVEEIAEAKETDVEKKIDTNVNIEKAESVQPAKEA
ncbi:hypothetical protein ACFL4B_00510 [Candidatus Neomarinimicrobiota bacterium]